MLSLQPWTKLVPRESMVVELKRWERYLIETIENQRKSKSEAELGSIVHESRACVLRRYYSRFFSSSSSCSSSSFLLLNGRCGSALFWTRAAEMMTSRTVSAPTTNERIKKEAVVWVGTVCLTNAGIVVLVVVWGWNNSRRAALAVFPSPPSKDPKAVSFRPMCSFLLRRVWPNIAPITNSGTIIGVVGIFHWLPWTI